MAVVINSSLAYEILLYLNTFYFGMFVLCQTSLAILKAINVPYPEGALKTEASLFLLLCIVELIRIFLGRRGNLAAKHIPVLASVLLTIPSSAGVCYFLLYQTYILRLEYIWCIVMLIFHSLELLFAIVFILSLCRSQPYE